MDHSQPHVYQIYIRTTPEALWRALTDGDITEQYYFGTRLRSTWETGASYDYTFPDGNLMVSGEVVEIDPPRKLVTTFKPHWKSDENLLPSRVTFTIEPRGDACKLTLIHDMMSEGYTPVALMDGWSIIFSQLKSLLETGQALMVAA